jgi:hypothetical protein
MLCHSPAEYRVDMASSAAPTCLHIPSSVLDFSPIPRGGHSAPSFGNGKLAAHAAVCMAAHRAGG